MNPEARSMGTRRDALIKQQWWPQHSRNNHSRQPCDKSREFQQATLLSVRQTLGAVGDKRHGIAAAQDTA